MVKIQETDAGSRIPLSLFYLWASVYNFTSIANGPQIAGTIKSVLPNVYMVGNCYMCFFFCLRIEMIEQKKSKIGVEF